MNRTRSYTFSLCRGADPIGWCIGGWRCKRRCRKCRIGSIAARPRVYTHEGLQNCDGCWAGCFEVSQFLHDPRFVLSRSIDFLESFRQTRRFDRDLICFVSLDFDQSDMTYFLLALRRDVIHNVRADGRMDFHSLFVFYFRSVSSSVSALKASVFVCNRTHLKSVCMLCHGVWFQVSVLEMRLQSMFVVHTLTMSSECPWVP